MGFAQVRLTLDNSAHTLDLDADEAVIGRKYYRSGESEYSINGQVCRLKDVYELLLDTGIGRDGYSVIGQGRIAEIVAAKSTERREIFEEACGIAKYRYRKKRGRTALGRCGGESGAAAGHPRRTGSPRGPAGKRERQGPEVPLLCGTSARRWKLPSGPTASTGPKEAVRRQVRDYETAEADYERFDRAAKSRRARLRRSGCRHSS